MLLFLVTARSVDFDVGDAPIIITFRLVDLGFLGTVTAADIVTAVCCQLQFTSWLNLVFVSIVAI